MSATLESKLEHAYATLARACEPLLADPKVNFRLATDLLNQPAPPEAEEGDDAASVPVPYVLLTAERGEENPPDSDIFPVTLGIEVADNAQIGSEDGALDALFAAAIRLLRCESVTDTATPPVTRPLPVALSAAGDGLAVLSTPQEFTGAPMEAQGSVYIRRASAVFFCHSTD